MNWQETMSEWLARLRRGQEWQRRQQFMTADRLSEVSTGGGPSEQELKLLLLGRSAVERQLVGTGRTLAARERESLRQRLLMQPGGDIADGKQAIAFAQRTVERLKPNTKQETELTQELETVEAAAGEKEIEEFNSAKKAANKKAAGEKAIDKKRALKIPAVEKSITEEDITKKSITEKSVAERIIAEKTASEHRDLEYAGLNLQFDNLHDNLLDHLTEKQNFTVQTDNEPFGENILPATARLAGLTDFEPEENWPAQVVQFAARKPETAGRPATVDGGAYGADVDRLADLVAEKLRDDIEAVLGSSSLV